MKIRDTAMGSWFQKLSVDDAAAYIARCLYETSGTVFWDIVKRHNLTAKTPMDLGYAVTEHLMEFDPEAEVEK